MKTSHIHAELIKAWADGAEIEVFDSADGSWDSISTPRWDTASLYRVKPEPRLSQTASDMVDNLIQSTNYAAHFANTVGERVYLLARVNATDQLKQYILKLEEGQYPNE